MTERWLGRPCMTCERWLGRPCMALYDRDGLGGPVGGLGGPVGGPDRGGL